MRTAAALDPTNQAIDQTKPRRSTNHPSPLFPLPSFPGANPDQPPTPSPPSSHITGADPGGAGGPGVHRHPGGDGQVPPALRVELAHGAHGRLHALVSPKRGGEGCVGGEGGSVVRAGGSKEGCLGHALTHTHTHARTHVHTPTRSATDPVAVVAILKELGCVISTHTHTYFCVIYTYMYIFIYMRYIYI